MIHRAELRKAARAWGLTLTRDNLGIYRLHPRGGRRNGRAVHGADLKTTIQEAVHGELAR